VFNHLNIHIIYHVQKLLIFSCVPYFVRVECIHIRIPTFQIQKEPLWDLTLSYFIISHAPVVACVSFRKVSGFCDLFEMGYVFAKCLLRVMVFIVWDFLDCC
jgi:hypothetical protein